MSKGKADDGAGSERVLQAWLVEQIENERLLDLIDGVDDLRRVADQFDDRFVPSLPIDYLLRRKSVEAALCILGQLDGVAVVSDRRSVSADPADRLYPDLVLWGTESGAMIPVELKVTTKAEREAIEELLAYDFEIANHLPFGAHADRPLIVVAREYTPLLEHAVASLLVWHARRILCLRVMGLGEAQRLQVHLPTPWTRIGQSGISSEAIATITMCVSLQGRNPTDPSTIEAAMTTAFQMVVREGDRLGSHGLAMLWRAREGAAAPWMITVAVVDSRAMFDVIRRHGFLGREDALTRWFDENADWTSTTPPSLYEIPARAYRFLERYGDPELELAAPWNRAWPGLRNIGVIAGMDFWGVLGDYARDVATHPVTQAELIGEAFHGDWTDPRFAFPLFMEILREAPFERGRFVPSELRRFGVLFGSLTGWIENTSADRDRTDAFAPQAEQAWLELLSPLRAIFRRYRSTPDVGPPPELGFGLGETANRSLLTLAAWQGWFLDEFISKKWPLHRFAFAVGVELCPLFDLSWQGARDASVDAALLTRARMRAEQLIEFLLEAMEDWQPSEDERVQCEASLSVALGGARGAGPQRAAVRTLGVDHLAGFLEVGLSLLDRFTFNLPHRLAPPSGWNVDWEWIRAQVAQAESDGKHVAVILSSDGELGIHTINLPADLAAAIRGSSDSDVLVGVESAASTLQRVSWEEVFRDGVGVFRTR